MEWTGDTSMIGRGIKKYRFLFLVLLVGFVLLLFPSQTSTEQDVSRAMPESTEPDLQTRLEELLGHLSGAGKCRVLLTEASGSQTHYETTQDRRRGDSSEEMRTQPVVISGTDRGEAGLVQRIDPPKYLGAVVLCQGADSAAVRLAIVDAVSTATGLGADKISVWKMK